MSGIRRFSASDSGPLGGLVALLPGAAASRCGPVLLAAWLLFACPVPAAADEAQRPQQPFNLRQWFTPERVTSTTTTLALLAVLSMAPALLLMTTCFVRIVIVLGLTRQALGTAGLPSNQVLAALALFMTAAIMSPVWVELYQEALLPYRDRQIDEQQFFARAAGPVRHFMARQIQRMGNTDDVWLFLKHTDCDLSEITTFDQVPLQALAPAFLLSELKTAFLIGFQIYLPFLVIDLVVSSVLASLGMVTLAPSLVSLPFKLLLFVLADGWHLVVGTLLDSFA